MYTATQASMLHRWKLNLNTCKKCMLRYWRIPLSVCKSHIAQFGKSYLSFLATNFSSTEYSKSSGSSIHRKNVRSTRTYVKSWNAIIKHTRAHTHSLPRHYDSDVIHVRKQNRTHAQRATRLWVELVLLPEFNGEAMLKSLQIGGVNPP